MKYFLNLLIFLLSICVYGEDKNYPITIGVQGEKINHILTDTNLFLFPNGSSYSNKIQVVNLLTDVATEIDLPINLKDAHLLKTNSYLLVAGEALAGFKVFKINLNSKDVTEVPGILSNPEGGLATSVYNDVICFSEKGISNNHYSLVKFDLSSNLKVVVVDSTHGNVFNNIRTNGTLVSYKNNKNNKIDFYNLSTKSFSSSAIVEKILGNFSYKLIQGEYQLLGNEIIFPVNLLDTTTGDVTARIVKMDIAGLVLLESEDLVLDAVNFFIGVKLHINNSHVFLYDSKISLNSEKPYLAAFKLTDFSLDTVFDVSLFSGLNVSNSNVSITDARFSYLIENVGSLPNVFLPDYKNIKVTLNNNGGDAVIDGSPEKLLHEFIQLTATNQPGSNFVKWVNDVDGSMLSTERNFAFSPIIDTHVSAVFTNESYVTVQTVEGGQVEGITGPVSNNTNATFTATTDTNFNFQKFLINDDGIVSESTDNPISVVVDGNIVITPVFVENSFKLVIVNDPINTYTLNTIDSHVAKIFNGASLNLSSSSNEINSEILGFYNQVNTSFIGSTLLFSDANLLTLNVLTPITGIIDNDFYLEFNDHNINDFVNEITQFKNLGSSEQLNSKLGYFDAANDANAIKFASNGFGGKALQIASTANLNTYVEGPKLDQLGTSFVLEAGIKLETGFSGDIYLLKDNVTGAIAWKVKANGAVQLNLNSANGDSFEVVTDSGLVLSNQLVRIQLVVDLLVPNASEIAKVYINDNLVNTTVNVAGAVFNTGTATLILSNTKTELFKRTAFFSLDIDYIKATMTANSANFAGFPDNFYSGEKEVEILEGASASILISNHFFRPIKNRMENGLIVGPVEYDDPSIPSVFHGVFEISLGLEYNNFEGSIFIDYFIKRPEDIAFKKIGQKLFDKPASSPWTTKFYWNSRSAAFDWSNTDAGPYRSTGPVQFKFELR